MVGRIRYPGDTDIPQAEHGDAGMKCERRPSRSCRARWRHGEAVDLGHVGQLPCDAAHGLGLHDRIAQRDAFQLEVAVAIGHPEAAQREAEAALAEEPVHCLRLWLVALSATQ